MEDCIKELDQEDAEKRQREEAEAAAEPSDIEPVSLDVNHVSCWLWSLVTF